MSLKNHKIIKNDACGCFLDQDINKTEDILCKEQESDVEIIIDPDVDETFHDFYKRQLTDGLPIIPPTKERVDKFLRFSSYPPDEVLTLLPPRQGKVTPEKIAINAVMAGCLPYFMPLIEQSILALADDKFNLAAINATTHPVAVCTLINGPISREYNINSGAGCLGPGNIGNATIGRAIRLCLINLAGAIPGIGDHATMGSPAKYSYCFAEAEENSPWLSLHVERGYQKQDSTVTLMAMESPHNVNDHRSHNGEDLLNTICHTISSAGSNNSHVPGELLVIMGPEHANMLAKEGWSKRDVKQYIHEQSHVPAYLGNKGGRKLDKKWIFDDNVLLTRDMEDVILVVAGGPGRHTMIAHSFGLGSNSVTRRIALE